MDTLATENKLLKQQLQQLTTQFDAQTKQMIAQSEQIKGLQKTINDLQNNIKDLTQSLTSKNTNRPDKRPKIDTDSDSDMEIETTQTKDKQFPALRKPKTNPPTLNIPHTSNKTLKTYIERTDTQTKTQPEKQPETDKPKTVPIVLRDAKNWNTIYKHLSQTQTKFTVGKANPLGIPITPETPDDHRHITRYFNNNNIPYHTYFLPEDRKINIIIKGLNNTLPLEDIQEDLSSKGFHPTELQWLKLGADRKTSSILKFLIPTTEKHIFDLDRLCHMVVRVETQRQSTYKTIRQCHRCQQFGHTITNCKAAPKCHKCAGNHFYTECTKPTDTPTKCYNCGGAHPANYSKCNKNPNNRRQTTPNTQNTPRPILNSAKTIPNMSYAQMANKTQTQTPSLPNLPNLDPKTTQLAFLIAQILQQTPLLSQLANGQ